MIKLRYINFVSLKYGEISTPYISLFWDKNDKDTKTYWCLSIGIIVGEIQIWTGKGLEEINEVDETPQ